MCRWLLRPEDRDRWVAQIGDAIGAGSTVGLNELRRGFGLRHHRGRRTIGLELQCDRLSGDSEFGQKASIQRLSEFVFISLNASK